MFCWYYQWKISKLADENYGVLSHEVSRHLKCCSECRRFYHLCRRMEKYDVERLPVAPYAAVQMQQRILQKLSSEPAVHRTEPVRSWRPWKIAAAVILLIFPAVVGWIVSSDLDQMLNNERITADHATGLTKLSEVVQERWIDDSTPLRPAGQYLVEPYQKHLQNMTRSGKQAAAFMFGCLNAGLQISEPRTKEEATVSQ